MALIRIICNSQLPKRPNGIDKVVKLAFMQRGLSDISEMASENNKKAFSGGLKPPHSELDLRARGLSNDDITDDSRVIAAKLHEMHTSHTEIPLTTPIVHTSAYRVHSVKHYTDAVKDVSHSISNIAK